MAVVEHTVRIANMLALLIVFVCAPGHAQAYDGYTLFSLYNSRYTYLVDMNKTVVKSWTHSQSGGYTCYLLEEGNIVRPAMSSNSQLSGGGEAGIVQKVNPSGTVVWQYQYSSSTVRTHHDIEPMPNGNVLLVAWEVKTAAQAVAAGYKSNVSIWPDHIIEVQPTGTSGGNIVWQWHFWDHLIQDYSSSKSNYGVVADHPELVNINIGTGSGDWSHINGISYYPELDQIVISSHTFNEVYVIDHSTTTAEAASHAGGRSGKGGDILYRWGKPSNYGASGSQVFYVVHAGAWVPAGLPGAGNIMAFNNREGMGTSVVVEIVPPSDSAGNYSRTTGQAFDPSLPTWSYTASGFYSNHLGGCQRLPNGNTLMVESTSGNMTEVNPAGAVQWNYARGGEISRALRYPATHAGIRTLLNLSSTADPVIPSQFVLGQNYPNPFNPSTAVRFELPVLSRVSIILHNLIGQRVAVMLDAERAAGVHTVTFDASALPSGVYLYSMDARPLEGAGMQNFKETRKLVVLK